MSVGILMILAILGCGLLVAAAGVALYFILAERKK
jgi:hypothetical protein